MLRPATAADLPRILEIRDSAGAERLSDPRALSDALARGLIDSGAVRVWQAPGAPVTAFAAADLETGTIIALLVAPGEQGRGIGRALLAAACDALRAGGRDVATITLEPGTSAERHYRAAGWTANGENASDAVILSKLLP